MAYSSANEKHNRCKYDQVSPEQLDMDNGPLFVANEFAIIF